jgi:hypothetical protein
MSSTSQLGAGPGGNADGPSASAIFSASRYESRAGDTPAGLDIPGKRAIYHNLLAGGVAEGNAVLEKVIRIDEGIRKVRPD